jgi:hypothetical protein
MQTGGSTPIRLAQDLNGKRNAWPGRLEMAKHRLKGGRTSDPVRRLRECRTCFRPLNNVAA